jgi:feruloyl-CoA synthase
VRGFAPVEIDLERRADGTLVMRSLLDLGEIGTPVIADLARWAHEQPDRTFLAERDGTGWRTISYADTSARAQHIALGLRANGAREDRPVAIVAENSIATALVLLGAQLAGVPVAPISTAYARDGADPSRFDAIIRDLQPAFVYVDERARYEVALRAHSTLAVIDELGELERDAPPLDVAIGPDTVAKILFTSGSTGVPKGVITTHRMMAANQAAMSCVWPLFESAPPVLVDWLPWHHCYGGSLVFNFVLRRGGTLYIDDGRPVPARFERTLANLAEIAPTMLFGVPRTYAMLVPALQRDAAFRARFFSRLQATYSGGAILAEPLWRALDALGREAPLGPAPVIVSWGATETAPFATGVHATDAGPRSIGTPAPGCTIKLAPVDGAFELRASGPNITPGYWRRPEATAAAFDDEGFYRTGDAGDLVDPQ